MSLSISAMAERDDDIFNYNIDEDRPSANDQTQNGAKRNAEEGLGIDEEIKVTKKRKPTVKLDENRLLSDPGIPTLRRMAKEKFKFKGKGHEFTDIQRMLVNYQLWLDDLFPKAQFLDGLTIIEKLGHTRRIQVMRSEWMREEKLKAFDANGDDENGDGPNGSNIPERSKTPVNEQATVPDLYGASPNASRVTSTTTRTADNEGLFLNDSDPGEDELDALLAEDASKAMNPAAVNLPSAADEYDDDWEALEGM